MSFTYELPGAPRFTPPVQPMTWAECVETERAEQLRAWSRRLADVSDTLPSRITDAMFARMQSFWGTR
jgi:hypothetical protein